MSAYVAPVCVALTSTWGWRRREQWSAATNIAAAGSHVHISEFGDPKHEHGSTEAELMKIALVRAVAVTALLHVSHAVKASDATPVAAPTASAEHGTIAYLDERNGFRDLQFGTPKSAVRGLTHANRSGFKATGRGTDVALSGPGCYTRTSERLKIGDVGLWEIIYCFHGDRLFSVNISTADGMPLYNALVAIWGKESSLTRGAEPGEDGHVRMEWQGHRVVARLEVSAVEVGGQLMPSRGDLEIWSIPLAAERASDQTEDERRRRATVGSSIERDM